MKPFYLSSETVLPIKCNLYRYIEYAKKSIASCARVEKIVLSGHSSGARQAAIRAAEMLQDERNALGRAVCSFA